MLGRDKVNGFFLGSEGDPTRSFCGLEILAWLCASYILCTQIDECRSYFRHRVAFRLLLLRGKDRLGGRESCLTDTDLCRLEYGLRKMVDASHTFGVACFS
jgi:hypothetical protein